MSIQLVAAVLDARDARLTGTRKLVLVTLANRADQHGKCWPSQDLIADECGISVRALSDHLKALQAEKFITRKTQHLGKGNGSRTTYTLHVDLLKVAPEEIAGAEVAHAKSVGCTGSTPRVTNRQEPSITNANALVRAQDAQPSSEQPKQKSQPRGSARGSRIPQNWNPGPEGYAFATKAGLSSQEINDETAEFRDYWIGVSGKTGVKLDWLATWRNHVRRTIKFRGRRSKQASRRSGWPVEDKLAVVDEVFGTIASASTGDACRTDHSSGASPGDIIDIEPVSARRVG